jgi:hypothetical protein
MRSSGAPNTAGGRSYIPDFTRNDTFPLSSVYPSPIETSSLQDQLQCPRFLTYGNRGDTPRLHIPPNSTKQERRPEIRSAFLLGWFAAC